jgi:hypothetical protein
LWKILHKTGRENKRRHAAKTNPLMTVHVSLFGSEAWAMTSRGETSLQAAEMAFSESGQRIHKTR